MKQIEWRTQGGKKSMRVLVHERVAVSRMVVICLHLLFVFCAVI